MFAKGLTNWLCISVSVGSCLVCLFWANLPALLDTPLASESNLLSCFQVVIVKVTESSVGLPNMWLMNMIDAQSEHASHSRTCPTWI